MTHHGAHHSLTLPSPEATSRFATALAPLLEPGDTLLLQGPIGAGKSHFARSLIQARLAVAGRVEDVPSPTFTLVQSYNDGRAEIWHADLYRLTHPDEVEETGLAQAFDQAICLVEWPDRLGELAPQGALMLAFEPGKTENDRKLTLSFSEPRWQGLLDMAMKDGGHFD